MHTIWPTMLMHAATAVNDFTIPSLNSSMHNIDINPAVHASRIPISPSNLLVLVLVRI